MYTNSITKYHNSLHISIIISLNPFINKKQFNNSIISFKIFTNILTKNTKHH